MLRQIFSMTCSAIHVTTNPTNPSAICGNCYGPELFIGAFSEIPDLHTVVWGIVRKDAICDLGEGLFSSNGIAMDLFPGYFVMRDMPPDYTKPGALLWELNDVNQGSGQLPRPFDDLRKMVWSCPIATPAPTKSPTRNPSAAPDIAEATHYPTATPTMVSTHRPTVTPSHRPTVIPTMKPMGSHTARPSKKKRVKSSRPSIRSACAPTARPSKGCLKKPSI